MGGQPLLWKQRHYRYRYLLKIKIIAALPLPLLNKNSSELSLPLFATATFGELLKFVLLCTSRLYFTVSP